MDPKAEFELALAAYRLLLANARYFRRLARVRGNEHAATAADGNLAQATGREPALRDLAAAAGLALDIPALRQEFDADAPVVASGRRVELPEPPEAEDLHEGEGLVEGPVEDLDGEDEQTDREEPYTGSDLQLSLF